MNNIIRNKFVRIGAEESNAIAQVLEGRALSGTAPNIGEYERELCRVFGSNHAIACSSGTSALTAALMALGIQHGDEVVLPPTAPAMTCLPVLALGAIPVFADVERINSFRLDPSDTERVVTSSTKAIVSVPMWGYPCWSRELADFARNRGIPIIEDAAQAHGSIADGEHVGTMGDIGCFSTHERKLICTGEGGFLLTNDETLNLRLREICMFGRQLIARTGLEQYVGKFGASIGLNFKLNSLAAALGSCQVRRLQDRISARTKNAAYLREGLASEAWLSEIPIDPRDQANYYAAVFEVDPSVGPGREVASYLADHRIVSDTLDYDYKPLYHLPVFAHQARSCPHAEALTERIIVLPTHEGLSTEDLDCVICTLKYGYTRSWS